MSDIDFDDASRLWRANKIKKGQNMFSYCCGAVKKNGQFCKAPPYHWKRSVGDKEARKLRTWGYCGYHRKQEIQEIQEIQENQT